MKKILLIFAGTVFLLLGVLGIILPGLPATPFFLLTAACYLKSSKRLYEWVVNHKVIGRFIKNYYERRAMTKRAKIISLVSMWLMLSISVIFFLKNLPIRIIVITAGLTGTFVILKVIKTYKEKK